MLNDQLSKEALHRPHGGILPQRKRSEINIFNCYLNTVIFPVLSNLLEFIQQPNSRKTKWWKKCWTLALNLMNVKRANPTWALWLHSSYLYGAGYGQNEVIIMDDMPKC